MRHELHQAVGRALNSTDQLQEGRHSAEGQRASRQLQCRPKEGDEVAQRKTEIDDKARQHAESRSLHHLVAQVALRVFEAIHHHFVALERLDEHSVLDGFLQNALHFRIAVAHVARKFPHFSHVNLAQSDENRHQNDDNQRNAAIHLIHIIERTDEKSHRGERAGDDLGEETHNIPHVQLQAIEHVARMSALLALPFRVENAVEHLLLHTVLGANAQDAVNPSAGDAEPETRQDEARHDGHSPIDGAAFVARGHVDGAMHGPNLQQRHGGAEQADNGVQESLQAIAFPRIPEPFRHTHRRVLRFVVRFKPFHVLCCKL